MKKGRQPSNQDIQSPENNPATGQNPSAGTSGANPTVPLNSMAPTFSMLKLIPVVSNLVRADGEIPSGFRRALH